jgi:hypothetical protein
MEQNKSKKNLKINTYNSFLEKDISKYKIYNFEKGNQLINYKIKKKRNNSNRNFKKKEYLISINNALNEVKEKMKLSQSRSLNKTKKELNNKNISKEKTMNNTFNTNNTWSNINSNKINQNSNNNTYINIAILTDDEISKNIENIEKDKNYKIKIIKNYNDFDIDNLEEINKKKLPLQKEYYSLNDKIKELDKIKNDLFISSTKFYLQNKERSIINKIKKIKRMNLEKKLELCGYNFNDKKKFKIYSDLKRLPTEICFGKGTSFFKKEEEDKEINSFKFFKNLKGKNKENKINSKIFHKLMVNGFTDSKNINKYDAVLENKLVINSNYKRKKNPIKEGQNLYQILIEKKILRNIIPKEIDYNTQFTINDIINNELHPFYRYQHKNLNFHSHLLSHEINYLFIEDFALGKMADKKKDKFIKKLDEKFHISSNLLMKRNEEFENEQRKQIDIKDSEIIKKKYLITKFEIAIKKSFYQFRRMKIDIKTYFNITRENIPIKYSEGLYLFKAIKDGDIENIEYLIKKNYKYALFNDEFGQTAFHICAKRNIYQVIQLLISRTGDINSKDIYGRTPLMCAAENGHLDIICVLLFYYADPNITDNNGKKAIDYIKLGNNINDITEYKIERALMFTGLVRCFLNNMINEKDFDIFMKNSLKFLFKQEINIDYESLIKANNFVMKDGDEKSIQKYNLFKNIINM